tara:strand:- start:111 stop:311 length:201 start_codon:yes stop_codon:yes gene_type:complete
MEVGIYDENQDPSFLNQHYFNRLAFDSYPKVYEPFEVDETVDTTINVILILLILILIYILYNTSKK